MKERIYTINKQLWLDFLKERKMKELPKTIVKYLYTNEPESRYYDIISNSIAHIKELGQAHQEYVNRQDACSIGVYALVKEYHKESKKEFIHTSKDNRSYHYSLLATPHLKNILAQERLNPRKRAILEYELSRREMMGEK